MSQPFTMLQKAVVLLIEDDPGDQALTRRAVESGRLPVDLQVVEHGEQALQYLRREGPYNDATTAPRPDIILLDLNLPGMSGHDLIAILREEPAWSAIPIVALTTSTAESDIQRAYSQGANSYVSKPLNMRDFVATLREISNYWLKFVHLPPAGRTP